MNPRRLRTTLLTLALSGATAATSAWGQQGADQELERQADALVDAYGNAYRSKDMDAMLKLFDPELGKAKQEIHRALFSAIFERGFSGAEATVESVKITASGLAVRVTVTEEYGTVEGPAEKRPKKQILFAEQRGDRWYLEGVAEEISGPDYDPGTRTYRSGAGRYTIRVPEGWIPIEAGADLELLTPDSACFLAPDMDTVGILGFLQLPILISPADAVKADMAAARRLTSDHRLLAEGPVSIGGLEGYHSITEFGEKAEPDEESQETSSGERTRRMRVYLIDGSMLYFLVFDVSPPDTFDALRPEFDSMVGSFSVLPAEEGLTTEETVAGRLAQGAVFERVYTSEEFNCFIAAPEGWEIRSSPNPVHLVEMQYGGGKSIARLLAAKGLPEKPDLLRSSFGQRLEAVKSIVENFNELSRRETTVRGVPAIESVQSYSLEGLGRFRVKEVTIVRDGTYYLILCQAIEPDSYEDLEGDFDQIIRSFGFIQ